MNDSETSKRNLGQKDIVIASKKTRKEIIPPMETKKSTKLLYIHRKILQDTMNTTETMNLEMPNEAENGFFNEKK